MEVRSRDVLRVQGQDMSMTVNEEEGSKISIARHEKQDKDSCRKMKMNNCSQVGSKNQKSPGDLST